MTSRNLPPPALARWLLRRVLDGAARSAIVGDLDEEFARFILPERGIRRARRWYWRQTVMSIAACARGAAAREPDPDRPTFKSARDAMHDSQGLATDLRSAVRVCVRSPLTSIAVIATLTIGVAANTAMFSVVNATVLKKLPIANADRLVSIESKGGGSFTYPEYLASRDTPGFSAVFAGGRTSALMSERESRRRVVVQMTTANYFDALGVGRAAHGRLLTADDDLPGQAPVAVLSYASWRQQFSATPAVVGGTITLHRTHFTIVGVAPRGFSGTQIGFSPDLWVPLTQAPLIHDNPSMLGAASAWLGMGGILARPDSLPAVRAALAARWQALDIREEPILRLIPRGMAWYVPALDTRLLMITLFAVLTLVIGCLNVSTLLGAAVHERQKELAIRTSLGAGRLRLLRQLLAEHLLLAAVAGIAGGVLGLWLTDTLAALMASRYAPGDLGATADRNVVLFTIAVSLSTGLAVGAVPALRWSKVSAIEALRGGGTAARGLLRSSGLWWLIPGQVALGTVLLASAGVLVETVHQLKRQIESSAPERIWFADVERDAALAAAASAGFQEGLRAHLRQMPGTEAVALASGRPLASIRRGPLRVEGMTVVPTSRPMPWGPPPPPPPRGAKPREKPWIVSNTYVTPGFFPALALPIVRGRDFTSADSAAAPRVAIVNETLAERAFGKASPIGRRVAWAQTPQFDIEIVGVVRDLRSEHLRETAPDSIFFPLAQIAAGDTREITATGAREPINLTMVLRAGRGQRVSRDQLVDQVRAFDPALFVDRVRTFDEEAGLALAQERLLAWLGSVFGAIAITLMIVGLYGSLAAAVARGRGEIGIRLALGATPGSVRAMVVGRSVGVVLAGLAVGFPLSYVFVKSFAHLLYGVEPMDPLVIGGIVAIIVSTAIFAAYFPARQAARVDPVTALRAE